jgi:hypothetical protein
MTSFILCALFVYGVHTVIHHTAEFFEIPMGRAYRLHHGWKYYARDVRGERPTWQKFFLRPLFYCNVCMSSIWGSIFYVANFGFEQPISWILHCVISAAIIAIINQILSFDVRIHN